MTADTPLPSGLPDVDRQWGGLAAGHAYLLVGRAGAGRSALALRTARAAVEAGDRCLMISPREPEALVETARGVGLDLAAAHGDGLLRLLRIPPAAELATRGSDGLAQSYRDLAALVASDRPGRVVVEDFTPLVQFGTFERFHDAFSDLVGAFRSQGVTLVIGLGDPANEASQRLLGVVEGLVDGTVRLGAGGDLVLETPNPVDYPSSDGASVDVAPPSEPAAPPVAAPLAVATQAAGPAPTLGSPAPPPGGFEATFAVSETPAPEAPSPEDAARPAPAAAPAAPVAEAPRAEAPGASGAGGPVATEPVPTEIVPPPPPDPSLLVAGGDLFGHDPADSLFEQGFLADSGRQPAAEPAPEPEVEAASPPGPAAAGSAFRAALDAAFDARADGTPFVVVALRMDPASPGAAHFETLEAGLRSALRSGDEVWVDGPRARAAAVLPKSGPEAGQELFAALQSHLRATLGAEAAGLLQSVAAVTLVDGRPFEDAARLLAYAVDG